MNQTQDRRPTLPRMVIVRREPDRLTRNPRTNELLAISAMTPYARLQWESGR